jgi:transposase InsO family protein
VAKKRAFAEVDLLRQNGRPREKLRLISGGVYSLSERMPDELVCQAVLNAWANAPAPVGSLFHSDRGSQYATSNFRRTIQSLGFVQSMSRKANCWENAVAESFFATPQR